MRRTVPEIPSHKCQPAITATAATSGNARRQELRDPRQLRRVSPITAELLADIGVVVVTDTKPHEESLADLRKRMFVLTSVTISACVLAGAFAGGAIASPC